LEKIAEIVPVPAQRPGLQAKD